MPVKISSLLPFLLLTAVVFAGGPELPYKLPGTGQINCYDDNTQISPPPAGTPYYGQDAQTAKNPPKYSRSRDGLTVFDENTGLTWQSSPETGGGGNLSAKDKLTFPQALALPAKLNSEKFGGFGDWRLPSIKELYSLFLASGSDPSGPREQGTAGLAPFIDVKYFKFAYGDTGAGERVIDSQYASSTKYTGKSVRDGGKLFGVNFADGRIKGYDLMMPGRGEKTFFVICVRGNTAYGRNDFKDNADGTVSDLATGLTWSRSDSGQGLNWKDALLFAQAQNKKKFLGYGDWRVPNIKELQSLVDYSRSPDATGSAAIDPVFECTKIINEAGQPDYPFYWSSTTHAGLRGGGAAMYVAFGRAAGWLSSRGRAKGPPAGMGRMPEDGGQSAEGSYEFMDVHGAGAQRSDPKAGDASDFPRGRGPQGDIIRIKNFVRLVRG